MSQDKLKQAVAQAAIDYIAPCLHRDSVVGVGTGSTANYFIDALSVIRHTFDAAVASSKVTAERLLGHGIPVVDLNGIGTIDFYIDGADESDYKLNLIKGGGGALTGEKIVASVAKNFICIADESKLVNTLGQFPLPVEVIPMARSYVARKIVALGGEPIYRQGVVTDNGNIIIDAHWVTIANPCQLEQELNQVAGVVSNGLFAYRPADLLLLGTPAGIRQLTASR